LVPPAPSTNFLKKLAKIGKNWQKLTDFQTFFLAIFNLFQVMEHIRDSFRTITLKKSDFPKKWKNSNFGQFLPILVTFYKVKITFFKKLVEGDQN
jgi:hypothetical protein